MEDPRFPSLYPVDIASERVRLREVTMDDARAAMAWATDPEWFRYLPHDPVSTLGEEQVFLQGVVDQALAVPRRQYNLGIIKLRTSELVGMARLGVSDPENRSADIGYGVRRDLWCRGLATEAAGLLLRLGFDTLRLHRIWAYHHPENPASGRVLAKIGMTKEGYLTQNMRAHGVWRDSVLYAIVRSEWETRGRPAPKSADS